MSLMLKETALGQGIVPAAGSEVLHTLSWFYWMNIDDKLILHIPPDEKKKTGNHLSVTGAAVKLYPTLNLSPRSALNTRYTCTCPYFESAATSRLPLYFEKLQYNCRYTQRRELRQGTFKIMLWSRWRCQNIVIQ